MGDLMTKSARTIREDVKAVDAIMAMESPTPVTFLPVVDADGVLRGMLTLHGLVSSGL